jgi:hypothetical protein
VDDRDYIDRRLRAANRVPVGTGNAASSDAVLDRIGARIIAEPVVDELPVRRAGRRKRLRVPSARRGVLLASAIGLVVVGGAAAATTILSTYTGHYTTGQDVQRFGSGQFLRIGASGFCQAAGNLAANVPYPDGDGQAWIDWSLLTDVGTKSKITIHQLCDTNGSLSQNADDGTGGDQTTSTLQGTFVQSAFCAWMDTWLRAKVNTDTAAASNAATEIAVALQWPASQAYDPDPIARTMKGNVVEGSNLGWFIPVQKAVQADDFAAVKSAFTLGDNGQGASVFTGECPGYMPNVASDNGTVLTRAMLGTAATNATMAARGGI